METLSTADPASANFGLSAYPDSGYFVLDQECGRLIADFGAPGSSKDPGHLHAGIFSYEVSTRQGRLIVDRGTATYAEGSERASLRGSAAHNTVRVDGLDQFEVWKSFRLGRRAAAHDIMYHRETGMETDSAYVSGWHDGYRRLGIRHRRTIFNLRIGGWLIQDDVVGHGWHSIESYLHLDPRIAPRLASDAIVLEPAGWSIVLVAMPEVLIQCDLYSPRLGQRLPAATIVARSRTYLPLRWLYWIAPFPPESLGWESPSEGLLALSAADRHLSLTLSS